METDIILLGLAITGVGMGLVFGSIILLWVVMEATMWIMPRLQRPEPAVTSTIEDKNSLASQRKRQAAVLAVAYALASEKDRIHEFPLPPTAIVSAWQAVMRSSNMSKRGNTR